MSGTLTAVGYSQAAILCCAADLRLLTLVSQLCLCGSREGSHADTTATDLGFHHASSISAVSGFDEVIRGTLVNTYSMTRNEIMRIHQRWVDDIAQNACVEPVQIISAPTNITHELDRNHSEIYLLCLAGAHVTGVTTSGLANNLKMLQKLQARVVICEAAREVLEAHLLTALLPSVEHANSHR